MLRSGRFARAALVVAVSLLAAGAATVRARQNAQPNPPQQPPPPSFRSETDLIEVDTIVTDRQGNAVRGLPKDDFTILDDGKPQPVSNLSFVDVPMASPAPPAAGRTTPDVSTNDVPFGGRVYVLILDDVQIEQEFTRDVIKQASLFVERYFQDRDLMAVVFTSGRKDVGQDFTNNRELLLAAIKKFNGRRPLVPDSAPLAIGAPPAPAGRGRGAPGPPPPGFRDPTQATVQADRTSLALSTLKFVRDLADWTNTTMPTQHKSFLFVSQGVSGLGDADPDSLFLTASRSRVTDAMADVIASATKANASIFAVDPRGLCAVVGCGGDAASAPDNAAVIPGHLSLQTLADDTGGRAVLRSNNFDTPFDRIVKDASSYYVLAYVVPPDRRPGSFHTISVRVNRPSVDVRSRVGYRLPGDTPAPKVQAATPAFRIEKVSEDVQAALNSPVPALGVSLAVSSVPFRGVGKNVSVLIVTELGNLTLGPPDADGRLRDEVEVSSLVLGTTAVKGGTTDHVHIALKPDTAQETQGAVRVLHRIELPPGTYKLRVAARDGNSGRVGSVFHDLEVPDFTKMPVAMSGLLLTSAHTSQLTTPVTDVRVSELLDTAPSARRQFLPSDELVALAEIYDSNKAAHEDVITTRIVNAGGKSVLETTDSVPIDRINGNQTLAYPYKARLHLDTLAPGAYALTMEVRARMKDNPTTSREVPFTIAP